MYIIEEFEEYYKHLIDLGLEVFGLFGQREVSKGESLVIGLSQEITTGKFDHQTAHISVMIPFVFDYRILPKTFNGIEVRCAVKCDTIPYCFSYLEEEEGVPYDVYYAPDKFLDYVDNNIDEIRLKLKRPDISKEEALDAICFGNFDKHVEKCEEIRIKRLCGNN